MPEHSQREILRLKEAPLDLLAEYLQNPTAKVAAEAELAYRAACAIQRQTEAVERSAAETARYTRYTFWVALFTALAAGAALIAVGVTVFTLNN